MYHSNESPTVHLWLFMSVFHMGTFWACAFVYNEQCQRHACFRLLIELGEFFIICRVPCNK